MRWHAVLDRLPNGPLLGAEIGVWRGDLSSELLTHRPELTLHLVDPWTDESQGINLTERSPGEESFQRVLKLASATGRGVVHRLAGVEAAPFIGDGSLDFVFIDARHNYRSVKEDIQTWRPKVKAGGWVGGHDYNVDRYPGCVTAVHEEFSNVLTDVDWTWFAWI